MMLKYISLFSGIGGFDLGFDRVGMECVLQVEKDNKARAVLAHHWPNVPRMELVEDVTKDKIRQLGIDSVDLLCGGFPCQDLSVAGQRKGLAGERSGLWFEFLRVIEELRPGWIVIENVPGLLSSDSGRDMGTILNGLGQCGYWWAYRVLDAQYYGVPQRRRRVFIVASLRKFAPQEVLFERESSPWDSAPSREAGPGFTAAITERTRDAGRTLEAQEDLAYALTNPGSGGRPHSRLIAWDNGQGDPNGDNSELAYALNGQVNQGIAFGGNNTSGEIDLACAFNAYASRRYDFESETFVAFQQNTRDEVRLINGDGQIAGALAAEAGMKQQNYIAATLNSGGNEGGFRTEPGEHLVITNAFNGYTGGADDNDAQGNHLVVAYKKRGGFGWSQSENLFPTLESEGGTHQGGPEKIPVVNNSSGVRRLTPLECERLQGFPDYWTDIGQSDSARYRQLGNAVCMPLAEWIGNRIKAICESLI